MPSLKQGTLQFTSTKRTNSIQNGKRTTGAEKAKAKRIEVSAESQNGTKISEALAISSDEESSAAAEVTVPAKRAHAGAKTRSPSGIARQATPQLPHTEKRRPSPAEIEREHLDVEDKTGRYRLYHNEVRSRMGYLQPVHSEGQNKIHQMLRFFDMSYEFGPCIGITRLERWERAEALGLDPPTEVRDILLTKEGTEKAEYAQCVFHDEV